MNTERGYGPQPISQAAVHYSEYAEHGCPVCKSGETSASVLIQIAGCSLARCAHCEVAYLVCDDSLVTVPANLSDYNEMVIPKHPLA